MFRWGIIGTGYVARKFAIALQEHPQHDVTYVWSRTAAHAQRFAKELGIAQVAPSFESCSTLAADCVYIATPPSLHAEQAIALLKARKPVLIEKPLALAADDAQQIVNAAQAASTFCMEGLWTLHLPLVKSLLEELRKGRIGEVRSISASFGLANTPEAADNQFNSQLGGGALAHRGIYGLALALAFAGPAALASAVATMGGTDVDEDATVVLRHSSGVLSTIRCSLRTRLGNDLVIEGTSGVIRVAAPIYRPFRATIETFSPTARASGRGSKFERQRESSLVQGLMQRTGGMLMARRGGTSLSGYYQGNGYIHQAEEARRCIEAGLIESPVAPHARSTEIMQLITQAQRTFSSARGKS